MISESLKYIAEDLNTYLKRKRNSSESWVQLGNITDQNGAVPEENNNKVILSLINLEHESYSNNAVNGTYSGGHINTVNPPLSFNMNIMFSALFNRYEESLKFISDTIYFFQSKAFFNAQNSPGLDERISQLAMEVIKLNYTETFNLWTSLGAKYMPSVPFKVRMLTFQSDHLVESTALVSSHGTSVQSGL